MKFTLSSNNSFLFTHCIALLELSLSDHLGKPGNSQKCLETMGKANKWLVRDAVFFFLFVCYPGEIRCQAEKVQKIEVSRNY